MTGLRLLSNIFLLAGVGALALIALNALDVDVMGVEPAQYVTPGTAPFPPRP